MLIDVEDLDALPQAPEEASKDVEIASKPRDVGVKITAVGGKITASFIFHLDRTREDNVAKYPLFGHVTSGLDVLLQVSNLYSDRDQLVVSLEFA